MRPRARRRRRVRDRQFPIPMRGNERVALKHGHVWVDKFPIPMRGNERFSVEKQLLSVAEQVSDPHEG